MIESTTGGPTCTIHGTPLSAIYKPNGTMGEMIPHWYCPLCQPFPIPAQRGSLLGREVPNA